MMNLLFHTAWILWISGLYLIHCQSIQLADNIFDAKGPYAIRLGRGLHYIKDGQRCEFPDLYTFHRMGFEAWKLPEGISKNVMSLPFNETLVPSLKDHHANQEMLSHQEFNRKIVLKNDKVFPMLNPGYVYYHDFIIVSWRIDDFNFRVAAIRRPQRHSYRRFHTYSTITHAPEVPQVPTHPNYSNLPLPEMSAHDIERDIEFLKSINYTTLNVTKFDLWGEDPRLITLSNYQGLNSSLWVSFCRRYRKQKPEVMMNYARLDFDENRNLFHHQVQDIHFENERGKEDQKNWTPLQMDSPTNTFYYLSTPVQPHRVVDLIPAKKWKDYKHFGHTISETYPLHHNSSKYWKYGEIRGGTSAQLIEGKTKLLSFFHSSNKPDTVGDRILKTYVMGAYVMCNKDPEYRVLKISRFPIVHRDMYTGNWAELTIPAYHPDYIVFPMTFILSRDHRKIYLCYGAQDKDGWVVTLDYHALMDSLQTINESCD
jgi:hypothetical protein